MIRRDASYRQVAAMVNKEQPAAQIVREVIDGAEPILRSAAKYIE